MEIISEETTARQLIIMGNGFDLLCGLRTRYQDYFNYRFGINLKKQIEQFNYSEKDFKIALRKELYNYFKIIDNFPGSHYYSFNDLTPRKITIEKLEIVKELETFFKGFLRNLKKKISNNINISDKETYRAQLKEIEQIHFNKWDVIFLLTGCFLSDNSLVQWNDVETVIFKVVSTILGDSEKEYFNDCTFNDDERAYRYLIDGIKNCFLDNEEDSDKDKVASEMLNQLRIFESNFANYIRKEVTSNSAQYYRIASKVINKLLHVNLHTFVDVLTFNYSLGPQVVRQVEKEFNDCHFDEKIELIINSWSNIHGIAFYDDKNFLDWLRFSKLGMGSNIKLQIPAPIFGIDNHDILTPDQDGNFNFDDSRSIFTKSFRLMDNHVNSIRNNTFQDKINVITFIGHSLNQADYSYFESIFDQYDIFHSNVKLEFYYYPGNITSNNSESERKAMKNIVRLLTSYGSTLKNEHGENIVNKLMLEQRLSVIPNPTVK